MTPARSHSEFYTSASVRTDLAKDRPLPWRTAIALPRGPAVSQLLIASPRPPARNERINPLHSPLPRRKRQRIDHLGAGQIAGISRQLVQRGLPRSV